MALLNKSIQRSYHIPIEKILLNDSKTIRPGMKIAENYLLQRELAGGSFGKIYESVDLTDRMNFAAKIVNNSISSLNEPSDDLSKEREILLKLKDEEGFPRVKDIVNTFSSDILIMSLLGPDLKTIQKRLGRLSLKTVSMIGIQALERIESLHNIGFIHRDIKPDNLLIGNHGKESLIHLIDFGLSIAYLNENCEHIPCKIKSKAAGTIYYLSVYGHLGFEASRRDDLISLGYVLLNLFYGELPWAKVTGTLKEKISAIYKIKSTISIGEMCKGLPEEFSEYFYYVYKLEYEEKPNYQYLRYLFTQTLENVGLTNDNLFDWSPKSQKQGIDLKGRNISSSSPTNLMKKNDVDEDP